jgi:D-sedoheptulose 7-phosphate isomerase
MSYTESYREQAQKAIELIDLDRVNQAIDWFRQVRAEDRQIFVCGNGGSASTASHFACEMLKGASYNRPRRFRIQALTDSVPTLTAYSNDVSYECVFVEQLRNFAREGDLVMGISSSGNSRNVVRAVEYANSIGCRTLALTGRDGGELGPIAGLELRIDAPHLGRVEDCHFIICHMISYYFMETEADRG